MTASHDPLAYAHDPRLAPLAAAVTPAWLWKVDGLRMVWSNAAAQALTRKAVRVDPLFGDQGNHPAANEIARLLGTLPSNGATQLCRLRSLTPALNGPLTCACSRLRLADGAACILIVGTKVAPGSSSADHKRPVDRDAGASAGTLVLNIDAPATAELESHHTVAADEAQPADVPAAAPLAETHERRTQLTVISAAKNVVPLRAGISEKRPVLNMVERHAFREIARSLGARIEGDDATGKTDEQASAGASGPITAAPANGRERSLETEAFETGLGERSVDERTKAGSAAAPTNRSLARSGGDRASPGSIERAALDRLPIAVVVFRGDTLLFGNRALLEWTGFETLDALAAAGGPDALFAG
ncbi:MAG TPA: hypothetical protein VHG27_04245, partial [Xanthobacteraceae bacterium]|nr:hypothetical protein [Xanthobacteraceae bacterium]